MPRSLAWFVLAVLAASPAWGGELSIVPLAGTGEQGYSGDGGPAAEARLNQPFGLTRGPDGALYVCDTGNHRVRRIDGETGIITTVAGTGEKGYSGDGGPAINAKLNEPYEVRFDAAGNMFFVERLNHCIRRVDAETGRISTVAGTGEAGYSGDGGPATEARFNQPHSIQFGPDGRLYVADVLNHRLRVVDLETGVVATLAGTGEKAKTPDGANFQTAPLHGPRALDFDRQGNLWLALREGNAVYRLDLKAGTIHHVAGTGQRGFTPRGGPAKTTPLSGPKGVSVGPDGYIYLADTESHSIRRIDPRRGTLHLVAGTGRRGFGPPGDPRRCRLARPHGVFVDRDGAIYIGDSENHRVWVVK
jgi:streptogramin lyase